MVVVVVADDGGGGCWWVVVWWWASGGGGWWWMMVDGDGDGDDKFCENIFLKLLAKNIVQVASGLMLIRKQQQLCGQYENDGIDGWPDLHLNVLFMNFAIYTFVHWGQLSSIWVFVGRIGISDVNTLRPRQNGRHFADDPFKRIFFNKTVRIFIQFSLTFVPKGPINNKPALVQIIAWHRPGDKPLSEPMMVSLPTHICVTRPQWVKQFVLKGLL